MLNFFPTNSVEEAIFTCRTMGTELAVKSGSLLLPGGLKVQPRFSIVWK